MAREPRRHREPVVIPPEGSHGPASTGFADMLSAFAAAQEKARRDADSNDDHAEMWRDFEARRERRRDTRVVLWSLFSAIASGLISGILVPWGLALITTRHLP